MSARTERRAIQRDLRRLGCDCTPTIDLRPRSAAAAVGATSGAYVAHELGCPLGDQCIPANRAGILPEFFTASGCAR